MLAFKALEGIALPYLQSLIEPYNPCRALRSPNTGILSEPLLKNTGQRSSRPSLFALLAPKLWKKLPAALRALWPCCRVSALRQGGRGFNSPAGSYQRMQKWEPISSSLALSKKGWIGGFLLGLLVRFHSTWAMREPLSIPISCHSDIDFLIVGMGVLDRVRLRDGVRFRCRNGGMSEWRNATVSPVWFPIQATFAACLSPSLTPFPVSLLSYQITPPPQINL